MQTARETSYEALHIILEHISSGAPVLARDLAIQELEAFRSDPTSRDVELLNVALKATGLTPYIIHPTEHLSTFDALSYEANRVSIGQNSLILHNEQERAYLALLSGKSLLLSAPTSFGKSTLLDAFLATKQPRTVVVIVPTIALLDEVRRRLRTTFPNYTFVTQAGSTPGSKTIYILTQERFLEIKEPPTPDFFMIDEFYKLSPGQLTEENERVLALNLCFQTLLRTGAQYLLTGPPIHNISPSLAEKLETVSITYSRFAPVSQTYEDRSKFAKTSSERQQDLLQTLRERDLGQTLVFCSSPTSTEKLANFISSALPINTPNIVKMLADWLESEYGESWSLISHIRSGIGIHHAQLPRSIQRAVLRLFNNHTLSTLICTSTIIEGVNTAARTVVIFDKKLGKSTPLDEFTFANIAGRAGRMGHYLRGHVISYISRPQQTRTEVDSPLVSQATDMKSEFLLELPSEKISNSSLRMRRNELLKEYEIPEDLAADLSGRDIPRCASIYKYLRTLDNTEFSQLQVEGLAEDSVLKKILFVIWQHFDSLNTKQCYREWYRYTAARTHLGDIKGEIFSRAQYNNSDYDRACREVFQFHRTSLSYRLPRNLSTFQIIYNYVALHEHMEITKLDATIASISCEFLPPYVTLLEEYGIPVPIAMKLVKFGYRPQNADDVIPHSALSATKYLSSGHSSHIERWFLEDFLDGIGYALL